MSEIKANASHDDARVIEATGGVRAIVRGRPAIVTAGAWEPVGDLQQTPHFVKARLITNESGDVEAQGTPVADGATQAVIDRLDWQKWPDET